MAMIAVDLTNQIIQEMSNLSENPLPSDAMNAFATAFKSYIEENLEITFSWVGVYMGATDPVTSFQSEITFPSFELTNQSPEDNSSTTALRLFADQLELKLMTGIITPKTESGMTVIPTTLLGTGSSINLTTSNSETQFNALNFICDQIITGIKTMINLTPVAGTHGNFAGNATMLLIN